VRKRIQDRLQKRRQHLNRPKRAPSERLQEILDAIKQSSKWHQKYPDQSKPKPRIPDLQDLQEEHANTSPLKTLHWRK